MTTSANSLFSARFWRYAQLLRLAPGSSVKRQPEKLLSDSAEPYIELLGFTGPIYAF